MKGFEHAFALLAGFNFADSESKMNALWLSHWLLNARMGNGSTNRPPAVLIHGPHITGKALAHRLLGGICGTSITQDLGTLNSGTIEEAATKEVTALILRNWSSLTKGAIDTLTHSVTATDWSYRIPEPAMDALHHALRRKSNCIVRTVRLRFVTIIITEEEIALTSDLARRVVIIELQDASTGKSKPASKKAAAKTAAKKA